MSNTIESNTENIVLIPRKHWMTTQKILEFAKIKTENTEENSKRQVEIQKTPRNPQNQDLS